MSSELRRGWDPGTGVLLKRVQLLRDRPPPRIKDATVLGVFQNATVEPLAIDLLQRSEGGAAQFFLAPHEVDKTIIWEGQAVASRLNGPDNVRLDLRKVGKPVAKGDITFCQLPPGYEYSPQWSERRTLYFRIFGNRIESVPAYEARDWKLVGHQSGLE